MIDQSCPSCGMQQNNFGANNGKGEQVGDQTFCCAGCSDGTGCDCR